MKIALVCRAHPTHRPGGMIHVFADRAAALAARGHEVHCITTGLPKKTRLPPEKSPVNVHYIPSEPEVYSAEFAAGCEALCNELQPDIIHLESLDINRPWWRSRPGNPKCIALTLHGFGYGSHFTRWQLYLHDREAAPAYDGKKLKAEADCFRKDFDVVIGISIHEHWLLRDTYGIFNAKLVYNPIAECFFDDPRDPPGIDFNGSRKVICAAISGQAIRGFEMAERAAVKAKIGFYEARGRIRSAMPLVYDAAHALVLPTLHCTGFDLAACEAIARRRPVIASAVGSYLREAESGPLAPYIKLVPVNDFNALVAAMKGPLPAVPAGAADIHRPDMHAINWLGVVG